MQKLGSKIGTDIIAGDIVSLEFEVESVDLARGLVTLAAHGKTFVAPTHDISMVCPLMRKGTRVDEVNERGEMTGVQGCVIAQDGLVTWVRASSGEDMLLDTMTLVRRVKTEKPA